MTRFWTFFINKNHFTILLGIVLILGGLYAMLSMPKESSPEIQVPIGVISTTLPGASASDVERLLTDKIEDRVLGVEHVSKVTSSSNSGISIVTVQFDANANIDKSIQLLKDEVDKVRPDLPSEAQAPVVTQVSFSDQPIIIVSISGDLAPAELTALGESAKDDLSRVSGVSRVEVSGVQARQVQVIVKQALLRQYNLSLSDVTNAIQASGVGSPAGSITVDNISYAVRLDAGIASSDQVGNIALQGPGGTPLHIRDVADVVDGLQNPTTYSRVSVAGTPSQPALTLSIYKSPGGNIVATGNAVKQKIKDLEGTTLEGTKAVISYDAAAQVNKDLTELTRAGLETIALVMVVLFVTLGWRESLVAAISVPFSFLIAFIALYATGNTLNFISLFALILAIGILVDSGIVVVEAFHTHLVESGNKRTAAIAAIREYAWPLTAGTFTTVAVFIPLFFLSGIVGQFIAGIPYTVIFVLIASIFVALGLVPLIAMYVVRPTLSRIEERQEEYNRLAKEWYQKFLRNMLENKKAGNRFFITMIALFVLAMSLPVIGVVHTIFFPQSDEDTVYVQIEKPQGTILTITDLSAREVEEILYSDPQVESFVTDVGEGSAFTGSSASGAQVANITVNLKPNHPPTTKIIDDMRKELSVVTSATVSVSQPQNGPSSGQPIAITFSGNDLSALSTTVEKAAQVLGTIPGTANINTSTKNDSAEFVVSLDTAKAVEQGVSPLVVASTLRTSLYGTKATSIRSGKNDIEVWVKTDLNPNYKDPSEVTYTTIDSVRELTIPSAQGPVPLSSIATITYAPAQTSISHEAGLRTVSLGADITKTGNAQIITAAFQKKFTEEMLPAGVSMKIGGETEDVNKSFVEMLIALLSGAALMLGILVLEFNSFRHSFYLLSIVPLSLVGVFAGLAITGSPLSFPSMLGVIALAGVIINHAIILMDSISRIAKTRPGQSLIDVVIEAASIRLRPIVLTTVTTVVGMIPLSLASAFWGPLAFTIMFGLAFSLLLTLVFIPLIYVRWPGKEVKKRFESSSIEAPAIS